MPRVYVIAGPNGSGKTTFAKTFKRQVKTMKKTPKIPEIFQKATKAFKIAVKEVMKEHRLRGLPIYVLKDNKIVKIPPHRIPR
jgi:ABC-type Mn2+/Zn2+ transport system ATPase subunit